jgi:hypothetical protein
VEEGREREAEFRGDGFLDNGGKKCPHSDPDTEILGILYVYTITSTNVEGLISNGIESIVCKLMNI